MNTNTKAGIAVKQTVLRYVLTAMGENLVMMSPSAVVKHLQPHKKGVEIFALVAKPEGVGAEESNFAGIGEPEPRRFYVAKTGETVQEASTYLGTASLPTMKSRHVFELA